jgi:hypothetical protein
LSIAAGLDLSSSSANAAAWDLPSSEVGVDLVEVQNRQALGGYEVLGSTGWTKVRHHRVYFIVSAGDFPLHFPLISCFVSVSRVFFFLLLSNCAISQQCIVGDFISLFH